MKRVIFAALLSVLPVALFAQQQTIYSDNTGIFNGISITGNVTAELIASDTNKVEMVLRDVDPNKFKWGVRDKFLTAELNSGQSSKGRVEMKIYYADTIQFITVSGSELMVREPIGGFMFRLGINGGGKVTAAFDVTDLEVSVTSNSAVHVSGVTKYLTLNATEKSRVDAFDLDCVAADVTAGTGAEIKVKVTERLEANSRTASSIYYKGGPSIVKDRTSKMNSGIGSGIFPVE